VEATLYSKRATKNRVAAELLRKVLLQTK
jgi:hypothetical protein